MIGVNEEDILSRYREAFFFFFFVIFIMIVVVVVIGCSSSSSSSSCGVGFRWCEMKLETITNG